MATARTMTGLWHDTRLVFWLQMRMWFNQPAGSKLSSGLSFAGMVIALLFMSVALSGLFFGAFMLAPRFEEIFISDARLDIFLPASLFVLSLIWQVFPLLNIQNEEKLRIEQFLPYPISNRRLFFMNLLGSAFDPLTLFFVPPLLTILVFGVPSDTSLGLRVLMVPLLIGFIFFNVALGRLIIAALENFLNSVWGRFFLMAGFVLVLSPGLAYVQMLLFKYGDQLRDFWRETYHWKGYVLQAIHLWPGTAPGTVIARLHQGRTLEGGLYLLLFILSFGFVFQLGLRQVFQLHAGSGSSSGQATQGPLQPSPSVRLMNAVPLAELAGVLHKEFAYLIRNWRILLNAFVPIIMVMVLAIVADIQQTIQQEEQVRIIPDGGIFWTVVPVLLAAYIVLVTNTLQSNAFGFDGEGVVSYIQLPLDPRIVLAGKNCAYLILSLGSLALCMTFLYLVEPKVSLSGLLPSLFVFLATFIWSTAIANVLSVAFPMAVSFEGNSQAVPFKTVLFGFASTPVTFGICLLGYWLYAAKPVSALLFVGGFGLVGVYAYFQSLSLCADMWEQDATDLVATIRTE